MTPRETIYQALFSTAQSATQFATFSRRLKHIEELSPVEFPAIYQVQLEEEWKQPSGNMPSVGDMHVEWWVYVYDTDTTTSHAAQLNPLVDALLAAVGLPPGVNRFGAQTLGGLVDSVRLDGKIQYAEGVFDDRAFARIPLLIKTPS